MKGWLAPSSWVSLSTWLARWSWVSLGRWLASWLWASLFVMACALRCWVTLPPWLAYKSWVSLLIGLAYPAGISLCLGLAYRSRDFSLFRARSLSVGSSKDVARSCRLGYYLCLGSLEMAGCLFRFGSLLPDGLLLFLGINNSIVTEDLFCIRSCHRQALALPSYPPEVRQKDLHHPPFRSRVQMCIRELAG